MNKAGLVLALTTVSTDLTAPWFEGIVTSGQIGKDELEGSSHLAAALAIKVRDASSEDVEPLVAQYDDVLTKHIDSFLAKRATDPFRAVKDVQVISGTVTMILAQANMKAIALD